MAATVQPSAEVVGNAFVHQYYLILHQSPDVVHHFYQDVSKLGRPEKGGVMSTTTTLQAINAKILSLGYGEYTAEITTVDSQDSHDGGVIVLVTGYLIGRDDVRQKFAQSFFLAPQDKGYFVLNDVFRYVDESKHEKENQDPIDNVERLITAHIDSSITEETHISEQSEEVNGEELYNPAENEDDGENEEEEVLVPEVVNEVSSDSQVVAEPNSKIEEVAKMSYASILKVMKDNASPFSTPAPAASRPIMKSPEHVIAVAPLTPPSEMQVSSSNATENGGTQETEVEGPSIYVKGLPLNATSALLENEFKKFGNIKTNGIQVRWQKGFCFGFVEFEVASAVQSAIEASPIMIDGCRVVVEEKRSTSRGNNKGRFSSGAGGGYRNDATRGRGNFGGGKAYNRSTDFRPEYGNRGGSRGGFSNRGGGDGYQRVDKMGNNSDGYQRGEKMGNNGGRASRNGNGMALSSTPKRVAPHVSATA